MYCKNDEEIANIRGCRGKPAKAPVETELYEGKTIKYYHCPWHFIPQSVHEWYRVYSFYKEFSSANMGTMNEQKTVFLLAYSFYKKFYGEFEAEMNLQEMKKIKAKNSLHRLSKRG